MTERLWTIEEMAKYARVSEDTIRRELERKQVEVIEVGRSIRIPDSEAKKVLRRKPYSDK